MAEAEFAGDAPEAEAVDGTDAANVSADAVDAAHASDTTF